MIIKGITFEDFLQYKKPSMFIATAFCDFKCEKECGLKGICQNSVLAKSQDINISTDRLILLYLNNNISKSVVFGGLEPMLQINDILEFISQFRKTCDDDVVIFTGYYKNEIQEQINELKKYKNIIVKFGRFIPNQKSHKDEVLGVNLASDNQYAEKIS